MDSTRSTPKARKKHPCEVCGWDIEPGETYERVVTFDSGDVLTWKAHIWPCQEATSLARDAGYGDGDGIITADDISEWVSESVRHERYPSNEAIEIQRRLEINTERWREAHEKGQLA